MLLPELQMHMRHTISLPLPAETSLLRHVARSCSGLGESLWKYLN